MSKSDPLHIVNCHIHTFTTDHTPWFFPHPLIFALRRLPFLIDLLTWAVRSEWLERMKAFHRTGSRDSQRAVLREILHYYPRSTRFVVLPMDMALIGHGPVSKDITEQHDELAALAGDADYGAQVIPFGTIYPDRDGGVEEFKRVVEEHGFRGLKLYTKLGYAPDHPVLMNEIYPFCVKHNLPVMAHCSRGGVYHKGWGSIRQDRVTAPIAWEPVLKAFPELRVCLAHFGGAEDWLAHLRDGFDPDRPAARDDNWVHQISQMITSGDYPNLWTDISYTIFTYQDTIPLLKLFLQDPDMRRRVLFGSDFYMTRQEALSEKAMSIRLRETLGEDAFRQIAETNPQVWLGETPEGS
ncbi:MAG: amidohydrolase [Rhodobacteraceae bacterium]|nr:amidohydrolase [Paracoccaceae bacterium]